MVDMERWPNFFIVGAPKAGTTSLYEYLRKIPEIYMSPIKEPRYFNSDKFRSYGKGKIAGISDKSKYLQLFKGVTNEKAVGEASPGYLRDPDSPKLIHDVVPDAKIIVIVRDPIERAFSDYLMMKSEGIATIPFHEIISKQINEGDDMQRFSHFLKNGMYSTSIKKFQSIFGLNQVKVLIFEEFIKEPLKTVYEVLDFLRVKIVPPENIEKVYNQYREPRGKTEQRILRNKTIAQLSNKILPGTLKMKIKSELLLKKAEKPQLSKNDRASLENFFQDDAKQLQIILNKKLPWEWIKP